MNDDRSTWTFDPARLALGEQPVFRSNRYVLTKLVSDAVPMAAWALDSLDFDLDARTLIALDENGRRHEVLVSDFDLVYPPKTRTLEVVLYKYLHQSEYGKRTVFAVSDDDVLFNIVTAENAANYDVIDRFTREVLA